jgi:uncharacterized protein (DUF924 family)
MAESAWVTEVLHFWFSELTEAHWFASTGQLDEQIRVRFLALHTRVLTQEGAGADAPRPLLAAVIVLDQFSRHLFRGTPRAFAADSLARRLSANALKQRFDVAMNEQERLFLYMPFEHSEQREDQQRSVALIASLGNVEWTRAAAAHKGIIDQFGRFPHRNAILNRASSASELALLQQPETWF